MRMKDKDIKIDRLNNKLNSYMQKKGLNNTNISESDIEEFAVNVLRSTNRSAFYNHLQLLNNILESKNINYQVKEEKLVDKCVVFDESKYFTKSQILDICDLLINACDKFIIYAMFYGILGKEYDDLRNIKIKDIAEDYSYILIDGRKILLDDVLKEYVKETIEQEVYVKNENGVYKYQEFNMNSEYLLKTINNKRNNYGLNKMGKSVFAVKLIKLSEELKAGGVNATLTASGLFYSGIMYKLFELESFYSVIWSISKIKNYLDVNGYNINANELAFKYHQFYHGTKSSIEN